MGDQVVVIGAGSAGCIVASRLSEDAGTTVVLLEAGPDYPDVHAAPDDIRSGYVMGGTDHDWGYLSEPARRRRRGRHPGRRARGGSSASGKGCRWVFLGQWHVDPAGDPQRL